MGRVGRPGEPPNILPVNYVLDERAIIMRVDSSSVIARDLGRMVSFEVDRFNEPLVTGWSVLATGVLDDATPEIAARWGTDRQVRLVPWAAGGKDLWLRIDPVHLTGRTVRAAMPL